MEVFGGQRVKDIPDDELAALMGVREGQEIEFKSEGYTAAGGTDAERQKGRYEVCKDIAGMANGGGGYIVLGVSEREHIATGFRSIARPDAEIRMIKSQCRDRIEPLIPGLEVVPRNIKFDNQNITVILIRVPTSEMHPHSFRWQDTTIFVRRYDDNVGHYPVSELEVALATRVAPRPQPGRYVRREPEKVLSEANALDESDPDSLATLMESRFKLEVGAEPYYRMYLLPTAPSDGLADTAEGSPLRAVLVAPKNLRVHGFGLREMVNIKPTDEGLWGESLGGDIRVNLLRNGFFEVRYPVNEYQFQWLAEKYRVQGAWLYPYTVCEFPVTVLRVAKQLFETARFTGELIVRQQYWNIKGYVLPGGHPGGRNFGWEGWTEKFARDHIFGRPVTVEAGFDADATAYQLVTQVYNAFSLDSKFIPLFDADRHFRESE